MRHWTRSCWNKTCRGRILPLCLRLSPLGFYYASCLHLKRGWHMSGYCTLYKFSTIASIYKPSPMKKWNVRDCFHLCTVHTAYRVQLWWFKLFLSSVDNQGTSEYRGRCSQTYNFTSRKSSKSRQHQETGELAQVCKKRGHMHTPHALRAEFERWKNKEPLEMNINIVHQKPHSSYHFHIHKPPVVL